ncbi:nuclease-related domain-containing protein [Paenibacillus sp. BIC5C1]|uniref:nuclease-related domain-containing protein n=1 Tax=Paenibacillus sp. BIC5C1 TaxID=3078263 RepID=UPI0028E836D9|nr:nuclease-related domain-containing protein [Paenibacillus sp. BIC5C1]
MSSDGFTLKEYILNQFAEEKDKFREITRLDDKDRQSYSDLLAKLIDLHEGSQSDASTEVKGKALENLVAFLLEKSSVFEVYENLRNSTNEIDQLVELNHIGKRLREFINLPGDIFLSECKNYNKKIGVTWVGKLYTLLADNHSKIGILFSYHGLAGSGWASSVGLTKKIFLMKEKLEEKTYIIDICKSDFEKIEQGHSLLELIESKMKALRLQTNFERFLSEKHPALLKGSNE